MTQKEFADLTGMDINAENFNEEYTKADRIYLAARNVDKQTFCKEYRKSGASATLCELTDAVEEHEEMLKDKTSIMHKVAFALIDTLLVIEDKAIASTIYARAIQLIGLKDCIKYKLQKNYDLMSKDREYLLSGIDSIPYNN